MKPRHIESSKTCDITCEDVRANVVSNCDSSRSVKMLLVFAISFGLGIGEWGVADRIILLQQIAAAAPINFAEPAQQANVEVLNGTDLVSVREIEKIFRQAQDYAREGNAGDAVELYQQLLDNAGGTLATLDEKKGIYRPLRVLVERALSENGDLLSTYRLVTDGAARGLMLTATEDKQLPVLREVVRRFFMSSVGDDAAYLLAYILMDRAEFIEARRLLNKVVTHPDRPPNKSFLLLRLAIVNARVGDVQGAEAARKELIAAGETAERLLLIDREITMAQAANRDSQAAEGWPLALGNPARTGHMKSLPEKSVQKYADWTGIWDETYRANIRVPEIKSVSYSGKNWREQSRSRLVRRWEHNGWLPTTKLLLSGGQVLFKSHAHKTSTDDASRPALVCLDAETGKLKWADPEQSVSNTSVDFQSIYFGPPGDEPTSPEEVALFGDTVSRDLALIDNIVYHLEGQVFWGSTAKRRFGEGELGNALVANDARTGKRLWKVPGDKPPEGDPRNRNAVQSVRDVRKFLASPTPAGRLLLVPVSRGSDLYLEARSGNPVDKGKLVWEAFLCAQPLQNAQAYTTRWSSVGVSVAGGQAYVATGNGFVCAVALTDGQVHWAARYRRTMDTSAWSRVVNSYGSPRELVIGWAEDTVIPMGDTLLLMPSDAPYIHFINRQTGELIRRVPQGKSKYVLGVLGDGLYVAGNDHVRKLSIRTGQPVAMANDSQGIVRSLGRGALTEKAVYVPVKDGIVILDPKDLNRVGDIKVDNPEEVQIGEARDERAGDPVGNLVCDGRYLVATGMERTRALGDIRERLKTLTTRIGNGDVGAMLARAKLRRSLGDLPRMLDDLRLAFKTKPSDATRESLLNGLLASTADNAGSAGDMLIEASRLADKLSTARNLRVLLAQAWHLVSTGKPDAADAAIELFLQVAQDQSDALEHFDFTDRNVRALASMAGSLALQEMARESSVRARLEERAQVALAAALNLQPNPSVGSEIAALEGKIPQLEQQIVEAGNQNLKLRATRSELETRTKPMEDRLKELSKQIEEVVENEGENSGRLKTMREEYEAARERFETDSANLANTEKQLRDLEDKVDAYREELAATTIRLPALKVGPSSDIGRLLALNRAYPTTDAAVQGIVKASERLHARGETELAEILLMDLSKSDRRPCVAAALAALGELHLKVGWYHDARRDFERLRAEFSGVVVPSHNGAKAEQVASTGLGRLPQGFTKSDSASVRTMPSPPWKQLWHQTTDTPKKFPGRLAYRIGFGDDDRSEFIDRHILLITTDDNRLRCRNVETGKDLWSHDMGKGSYFASGQRLLLYSDTRFPNGNVMRFGHVAFLRSPGKVTALGLVTGKVLWTADSNVFSGDNIALFPGSYGPYNRIGRLALGAGIVAEIRIDRKNFANEVHVTDAITGKKRWVRRFDNDCATGLRVNGRHVIIFLNDSNVEKVSPMWTLMVCDRLTGKVTGRFELENLSPRSQILWTDNGVVYATEEGLAMRALPTGRLNWEAEHRAGGMKPKPRTYSSDAGGSWGTYPTPYRMAMLDKDTAYIVHYLPNSEYRLRMVDTKSGKQTLDIGFNVLGKYFTDAALSPDRKDLYIIAGPGDASRTILGIFDAATGKLRSKMALDQRDNAKTIAAAGELVPAVLRDPPIDKGEGRKEDTNLYRVIFYRKSDGKYVEGLKLPVSRDDGKFDGLPAVEVRNNVLLVSSYNDGIYAFGRDSRDKSGESKN